MALVVFRTDASDRIGSGHVSRCLALADALRERGCEAWFVCREHPGNLCARIEAQGFRVLRLPAAPAGQGPGEGHAGWLGVDPMQDAEATREALAAAGASAQWLVVDHYALDAGWERAMRRTARRILAIDDLADRDHDCDVLLDQNLVAGQATRYLAHLPSGAVQLLGPAYALLQPAFAPLHRDARPREAPVRRLFVFFGGSDATGLTGRFLEAFADRAFETVHADVVLPFGSAVPAASARASFHSNLPSLAPLMAQADLALGAGGVSSWERCCLGLPALVVTIADNQRPIARELDRIGVVRYLGHHDEVTAHDISVGLASALSSGELAAWSRHCLQLVDGLGAQRVAEAMTLDARAGLRARAADAGDEALLLEWANDPVVRRNAFNGAAIDAASHAAWFRRRLQAPAECRIFVVESELGLPVGQARFEAHGEEWTIDYSVSPLLRGRGLGEPVLRLALSEMARIAPDGQAVGAVKLENGPSLKVFEALGFERRAHADTVDYRRRLKDFQ